MKNICMTAGSLRNEEMQLESCRCLYCYDPPCRKACPARINIPAFIRRIREGNIQGAAETIFNDNILGGTCARVCPTEELCEGKCVVGSWTGKPVAIALLQRYATDWFFAHRRTLDFKKASLSQQQQVAIIGAGPAGLSCAVELASKGFKVRVYDAGDVPGGTAMQAIAPFKLPAAIVHKEFVLVKNLGVKFSFNTRVGSDVSLNELKEHYDAIFLGTGLGSGAEIDIPGARLRGIFDALEFLARARSSKSIKPGKHVVVIGGGNTALDAAITARLAGAEHVTVSYRRSQKEMRGYKNELDMARLSECWFYWQTQPVRFLGKNHVEVVRLVKTQLGKADGSGRASPQPIKGTEFTIPADMVLLALGQRPECSLFAGFNGLKTTEHGLIKINPATGSTGASGIFAGGDCVSGGGTVVEAVAQGKTAARGIAQFLASADI